METLGPQNYKHFVVNSPLRTHFRAARSCEEAECPRYSNGFRVTLDPGNERFERQVAAIKTSRKGYTVEKLESGLVEFTFPPGQDCFDLPNHRIRLDRDELYGVRESPDARTVPLKYYQWQDDFALHQESVKRRIEGA